MSWRYLHAFCLLVATGMAASLQGQPVAGGSAVLDYIGIYQRYISGMNRSRCPMYPSCSHYGLMVFEDYPFPVAMAFMADRMLRCGNHPDYYAAVTIDNDIRMLDFPTSRQENARKMENKPHRVAAETIIPTDSTSKVIQFVNSLVNQQLYASALLEIDRLLYYDTLFRSDPRLYINKMRCLEGMLQYTDAILFFEQRIPDNVKHSYKVLYTAAHIYGLVDDNDKSISLFNESALFWDSTDVHPFGELAILYSKQNQFDAAKSALKNKYAIDSALSSYTASVAAVDRLALAKYKNSTTAMLFGIIPGAGYLYTQQSGSAITSLLVNGLLAYATYSSFKSGNSGAGIIFGIFSVSFYIGNIAGSGNSATRYNEKIRNDAITELRNANPFFY